MCGDLRRLVAFGRAQHDAAMPGSTSKGPYFRPRVASRRCLDDEAPVEALASAEPLGRRSDGTRRTTRRRRPARPSLASAANGRCAKTLTVLAPKLEPRSAGSACGRSSTRLRSPRPTPCDRSSRGGRSPASTDRATSSPSCWRANRTRSTRLRRTRSAGRCGTRRSGLTSGTPAPVSGRPWHTNARDGDDERQREDAPDHRHPSRNPPSNQSHSR